MHRAVSIARKRRRLLGGVVFVCICFCCWIAVFLGSADAARGGAKNGGGGGARTRWKAQQQAVQINAVTVKANSDAEQKVENAVGKMPELKKMPSNKMARKSPKKKKKKKEAENLNPAEQSANANQQQQAEAANADKKPENKIGTERNDKKQQTVKENTKGKSGGKSSSSSSSSSHSSSNESKAKSQGRHESSKNAIDGKKAVEGNADHQQLEVGGEAEKRKKSSKKCASAENCAIATKNAKIEHSPDEVGENGKNHLDGGGNAIGAGTSNAAHVEEQKHEAKKKEAEALEHEAGKIPKMPTLGKSNERKMAQQRERQQNVAKHDADQRRHAKNVGIERAENHGLEANANNGVAVADDRTMHFGTDLLEPAAVEAQKNFVGNTKNSEEQVKINHGTNANAKEKILRNKEQGRKDENGGNLIGSGMEKEAQNAMETVPDGQNPLPETTMALKEEEKKVKEENLTAAEEAGSQHRKIEKILVEYATKVGKNSPAASNANTERHNEEGNNNAHSSNADAVIEQKSVRNNKADGEMKMPHQWEAGTAKMPKAEKAAANAADSIWHEKTDGRESGMHIAEEADKTMAPGSGGTGATSKDSDRHHPMASSDESNAKQQMERKTSGNVALRNESGSAAAAAGRHQHPERQQMPTMKISAEMDRQSKMPSADINSNENKTNENEQQQEQRHSSKGSNNDGKNQVLGKWPFTGEETRKMPMQEIIKGKMPMLDNVRGKAHELGNTLRQNAQAVPKAMNEALEKKKKS